MIIDTIQEWFKEVLIDGIISNLSGTFDTVNTKVACCTATALEIIIGLDKALLCLVN